MEKNSIAGSVGPAAVTPSRVGGRFTTVFFFLFAAIIWIATRGPGAALDLFENGHWLAPASDMLAGKVPYRDTFPMHGFLSDGGRDYLVFRLFGTSFRASVEARHVIESFFHPAIFLVTAAASRRPLLAALVVPVNVGMAIAVMADRPVLPLLSLAAFEDEVLRDLEARRPALVFLTSGTWLDAIDGIPNPHRIPRVWKWVEENYPVRAKVGDTVVALPRDHP